MLILSNTKGSASLWHRIRSDPIVIPKLNFIRSFEKMGGFHATWLRRSMMEEGLKNVTIPPRCNENRVWSHAAKVMWAQIVETRSIIDEFGKKICRSLFANSEMLSSFWLPPDRDLNKAGSWWDFESVAIDSMSFPTPLDTLITIGHFRSETFETGEHYFIRFLHGFDWWVSPARWAHELLTIIIFLFELFS
jgi:hypothetical protein